MHCVTAYISIFDQLSLVVVTFPPPRFFGPLTYVALELILMEWNLSHGHLHLFGESSCMSYDQSCLSQVLQIT